MTSTIRDLTELLAVATNDYVLISDTSDTTNRDKRISVVNMLAAGITGGGVLATGGFTLTVPATGIAALKSGTPLAGRVAGWLDANTVQDGGFALTDIARLSQAPTFTSKVQAPAFSSAYITLNTDTATIVATIPAGNAVMMMFSNLQEATSYGVVCFRPQNVAFAQAMVVGSSVNTTTGALAGTTGTTGKTTVSIDTSGNIYIENRMGSLRQYKVLIIY